MNKCDRITERKRVKQKSRTPFIIAESQISIRNNYACTFHNSLCMGYLRFWCNTKGIPNFCTRFKMVSARSKKSAIRNISNYVSKQIKGRWISSTYTNQTICLRQVNKTKDENTFLTTIVRSGVPKLLTHLPELGHGYRLGMLPSFGLPHFLSAMIAICIL